MRSVLARVSALTATLACAVALSGCITLFPEAKPAGLYRFTVEPPPASAEAGAVKVQRTPTSFTRPAAGDGILTITGSEAAYIADARWVAPASTLFDEALSRAFQGGRARLIGRGETARAAYNLKTEVLTFEARYDQGADAAPLVVVQVRGVFLRNSDSSLIGDRIFTAQVRASDNRLSAIIPAYSAAVGQTLSELAAWVGSTGTPN